MERSGAPAFAAEPRGEPRVGSIGDALISEVPAGVIAGVGDVGCTATMAGRKWATRLCRVPLSA